MPQGEEGPEQRKSDLFSTALVDNCQFRSLVFIFVADQLTATLPWLCTSWITSTWRYPIIVDISILTNAWFFWKKKTKRFLLLTDWTTVCKKKSTTCYSSCVFKKRTEAWTKNLIPALVLRTILQHPLQGLRSQPPKYRLWRNEGQQIWWLGPKSYINTVSILIIDATF